MSISQEQGDAYRLPVRQMFSTPACDGIVHEMLVLVSHEGIMAISFHLFSAHIDFAATFLWICLRTPLSQCPIAIF